MKFRLPEDFSGAGREREQAETNAAPAIPVTAAFKKLLREVNPGFFMQYHGWHGR
jgi:hypothetical protein